MYANLFKRPMHFIFRVGQLMGRQMGREEFQANHSPRKERLLMGRLQYGDMTDEPDSYWTTRLKGGDSCHAIVFHLFMENAKDLSKVVQNDGISLLSIIKIPNHPRF